MTAVLTVVVVLVAVVAVVVVQNVVMRRRGYGIPGLGLAGDWPGGWTQTFAQIDTEAGAHGFDENYFMQQVAGLSQIAGELMQVRPQMIDLGWGKLKSALVKLKDSDFLASPDPASKRGALVGRYVEAFRDVESGQNADAKLKDLAADISAAVIPEPRGELLKLVEAQRALKA